VRNTRKHSQSGGGKKTVDKLRCRYMKGKGRKEENSGHGDRMVLIPELAVTIRNEDISAGSELTAWPYQMKEPTEC